MNRSLVAVGLGLVAVGVLIGSAVVSARPTEKKVIAPLRAGYVDARELMQKWRKWQQKAAEMNAQRQQKGFELNGLRATLERKKAEAAAAAAGDKARLDREVIDAQRKFEDAERAARTDLDGESQKILADFYARCKAEVTALAKDLDLDVIYFAPATPQFLPEKPASTMQMDLYFRPPSLMPAYVKDGLDVTNDLLERLNKGE